VKKTAKVLRDIRENATLLLERISEHSLARIYKGVGVFAVFVLVVSGITLITSNHTYSQNAGGPTDSSRFFNPLAFIGGMASQKVANSLTGEGYTGSGEIDKDIFIATVYGTSLIQTRSPIMAYPETLLHTVTESDAEGSAGGTGLEKKEVIKYAVQTGDTPDK